MDAREEKTSMSKITYRRKQHIARYSPEESRQYVLEFQKRQAERIGDDPVYQEANLFNCISDERFLWCGWERVKENAGACGIDMESVQYFESVGAAYRIHKLSQALRDGTYKSMPLRVVMIPKPGGGYRELHIPAIEDRKVMAAMVLSMESLIRNRFRDLPVHGFIPGRGPQTAIDEIKKSLIAQEAKYAAHLDVVAFFDSLQQERLRLCLRRYTDDKRAEKIIMTWVRTGCMTGGLYVPAHEGVPQGSPLSPTLANIYLEEFDRWMSSPEVVEEYGLFYLRYADNLLLLINRKPDDLIAAVKDRLVQVGLQVKAKIGGGNGWKKIEKPWSFLGFILNKQADGTFQIRPHPERIRQKMEAFQERRQRTERYIHRAAQGLVRYYAIGDADDLKVTLREHDDPVEAMEKWLRTRR